jgi:hypothetical protein
MITTVLPSRGDHGGISDDFVCSVAHAIMFSSQNTKGLFCLRASHPFAQPDKRTAASDLRLESLNAEATDIDPAHAVDG